ncbi:MAG: amidohydrolase family protein [Planctomycetota bacterium]|nr:amidohydrolase family protein [Planctomycetota bacterium]
MTRRTALRIDGACVADAERAYSPGSLLLELTDETPPVQGAIHARARVLAVGGPEDVAADARGAGARVLDMRSHAVLPAFVNAHTHLDLTCVGPRAYDPALGFGGFVEVVRAARPTSAEAIAASVRAGVEASIRGGVAIVGDICGAVGGRASAHAFEALRDSPLWGVGFLEFFAVGGSTPRAFAALREALERAEAGGRTGTRVRPGVQPHAPYSVGIEGYASAWDICRERGLAFATHLAETLEEREFVELGRGPRRAFLEQIGLWDEHAAREVGHGRSPIAHVARALGGWSPGDPPRVAAHVNDLGDDLGTLAAAKFAVVYCPRASAYFGAERVMGAHRYREMLAAGIPVALGTDSVINLPEDARPLVLGVLDEARRLFSRDAVDAQTLLRMATVHGCAALGISTAHALLGPGCEPAGIVGVPVGPSAGLSGVFAGSEPPAMLVLGK